VDREHLESLVTHNIEAAVGPLSPTAVPDTYLLALDYQVRGGSTTLDVDLRARSLSLRWEVPDAVDLVDHGSLRCDLEPRSFMDESLLQMESLERLGENPQVGHEWNGDLEIFEVVRYNLW